MFKNSFIVSNTKHLCFVCFSFCVVFSGRLLEKSDPLERPELHRKVLSKAYPLLSWVGFSLHKGSRKKGLIRNWLALHLDKCVWPFDLSITTSINLSNLRIKTSCLATYYTVRTRPSLLPSISARSASFCWETPCRRAVDTSTVYLAWTVLLCK